MSLCGSFLSDEQFQCSICLDVFTNPSSTPCGHSFCMACINRYWDGSKVCQCPLCKKTFQKRPDLQINRTLREITDQFRSMTGAGSGGGSGGGGGGGGGGGAGAAGREKRGGRGGKEAGLPHSFMMELSRRLPRPLLTPRGSPPNGEPFPGAPAGQTSLASSVPSQSPISAWSQAPGPPQPPAIAPRPGSRRRFTVSGAASSENIPLCEIHHRGIMVFCRTDGECLCPNCAEEQHHDHDTVTIEEQWAGKKTELRASELEIQDMIRQRLKKIEEIRASVAELEVAVERETAGSVAVFSALVSAVERSQAELLEVMEMSRRAAEHQADALIRQLELEVEELRRRESSLAQLAQSEDHIHCVKSFPAVAGPPPTRDWSGVSLASDLGTGTIYRSLAAQLQRFQEQLWSVAETGFPAPAPEPTPLRAQPKMRRVQEYAVDVTLDSNTAHPRLILSDDMKSVRCGDRHQMLPDNTERFDRVVCVLGKQAITSGRHYWEVQVGGKTDWDLGVARQSINRKGKIEVTPSNGYWFLSLRDKNKYAFRSEPSTDVQLSLRPHKIGIFVDFEKGQVSFYNVDAKLHIYTFNDAFSECVYPFFSPCTNKSGKNDGPLVITPVCLSD